jgi:D-aminoacyl-tRNA deacylase
VRAVVQRVSRARATPGGAIRHGVCILLGVARADDVAVAEHLADKVASLRIFEDEARRLDRSLLDVAGSAALVVSQFTLMADTRKGNRPGFTDAAPAELAEPLYEHFCQALRDMGVPVETGVFGARMQVEIVNDGPVTIIVEEGGT